MSLPMYYHPKSVLLDIVKAGKLLQNRPPFDNELCLRSKTSPWHILIEGFKAAEKPRKGILYLAGHKVLEHPSHSNWCITRQGVTAKHILADKATPDTFFNVLLSLHPSQVLGIWSSMRLAILAALFLIAVSILVVLLHYHIVLSIFLS